MWSCPRAPDRLIGGELRIARKHPGCAEQAQQEIYQWVREAVTSGERHAWLAPLVCGYLGVGVGLASFPPKQRGADESTQAYAC
jgi:hypothetical protein